VWDYKRGSILQIEIPLPGSTTRLVVVPSTACSPSKASSADRSSRPPTAFKSLAMGRRVLNAEIRSTDGPFRIEQPRPLSTPSLARSTVLTGRPAEHGGRTPRLRVLWSPASSIVIAGRVRRCKHLYSSKVVIASESAGRSETSLSAVRPTSCCRFFDSADHRLRLRQAKPTSEFELSPHFEAATWEGRVKRIPRRLSFGKLPNFPFLRSSQSLGNLTP
jgi:hypothetical protein